MLSENLSKNRSYTLIKKSIRIIQSLILQINLFLERNYLTVRSWLDVYPVYSSQWGVLLVFGFYGDLAAEAERASGLEDEGSVSHFDGFGVGFAHVDVEGDLLEFEVDLFLGEQLPHVLLFGFAEMRLLGLDFH
jgi:hypothetical protein